jgi:hypothetical protein
LLVLQSSIVAVFVVQGAVGLFFSGLSTVIAKALGLAYLVLYLTSLRYRVSSARTPAPAAAGSPVVRRQAAGGKDEASP